jgi:hypothetical protein
MYRKLLIISCWIIIIPILSIGLYKILIQYGTIERVKNEGMEAEVMIVKKWRGKCGSGHGNSATFITIIDGKELTFTSTCNVPNDVKVGDWYYVKYLKEDPSKNLIQFDRKITKAP